MTKIDEKRIDDLKGVVDGIDNRVKYLEEKVNQTREEALASNLEQYKMITQAVAEGNKPIMEKIEKQEKRIVVLENAEANKALTEKKEIWKTIRAVVITFFATLILNNLIVIATSTNQNDVNKVEEVNK